MAGPGGVEAGRASVRVLPDTSAFGRSLLRYLQRVERTLRVEIPTVLNVDGIAGDVERVRRQTERQAPVTLPVAPDADDFARRIRSDVRKLARQVEVDIPVTADGEKLRQDLTRQVAGLEAALSIGVPVGVENATAFRQQVLAQVAEIEALAKAAHPTIEVDVDVSKIGVASALAAGGLKRATDAGSALTTISGQLSVSVANVGAKLITWGPPILLAAGGLAAMLASAVTMLPLLFGVGAAVGVIAISAKGLKKAFDPFTDSVKKLQAPITKVVTAGIRPLASELATKLVPVLKTGLTGIGSLVNDVLKGLLKFASSSAGLKLVRDLFAGLKTALTPLGNALVPFVKGLLGLTNAALPGLTILTTSLGNAATRFAAWVKEGTKSGDLTKTISNSVKTVIAFTSGLFNVLKSLFTFLNDIAPAASVVFGAIGRAITTALTAVRPFAQAITDLFTGKSGLGDAFSGVTAGLSSFAGSIQTAFAIVAPAISNFVAAVLPTLKELGRQILSVIGPALSQIGTIISTQVAPAFAAFLPAITPVANFIVKFIGGAVVGALKGAVNVIKGALVIIAGILNVFAGLFSGDWSRLWKGAKQIVSGAWTAIKGIIQVFLNVGILKILRLGFRIIRALFTTLGGGIRSASSAAWNGVKSIISAAWTAIKNIVVKGASAVLNAVKAIPGKIKSALSGLKNLLLAAGRSVVDGFVNGIKSSAGRVVAAAKALANNIPGPIQKLLQIGSPSKLMARFGRWVGDGLRDGLLGSVAQVKAAAERIASNVSRPIAKAARNEVAALKGLAAQRAALAEKLKAARDKLEAAVKLRDDFAKSVASGILSAGNITGQTDADAATIANRLRAQVKNTRAFAAQLKALRAAGLNKQSLQQIIEAGVDAGSATAQSLLTGGKGAIRTVNDLAGQLAKAAGSVGRLGASALYQGGVDTARGLVKGFESQASVLAKAAKRVARQLIAELRKALKIGSPSKLAADEVGRWIPRGVIDGVSAEQRNLDAAIAGMVRLPRPRGVDFAAPGADQVGGGSQVVINGNVGYDPAELARQIDKRKRDAIAVHNLALAV